MTDLDVTALETIEELAVDLDARGIRLVIARARRVVRAQLARSPSLRPLLPSRRFFFRVEEAVESYKAHGPTP